MARGEGAKRVIGDSSGKNGERGDPTSEEEEGKKKNEEWGKRRSPGGATQAVGERERVFVLLQTYVLLQT